MTTSTTPNTFLVLAFDHPLRAIESVAQRMAAGLGALGLDARVLTLPRDNALLAQCPPEQVLGVLSLGPIPLGTRVSTSAGTLPLWEHFRCPVSVYLLDALLYDLARVPVMWSFLAAAQSQRRLGLVSPEQGYRDWLGGALKVRWEHLPFAAFPRLQPGTPPVPAQPRVCVVGTIGSELGGSQVGETLPNLLERMASRFTLPWQRERLVDALLAPDAHVMPALTVAHSLGWSPAEALRPESLPLLIAVDSWIKRERRLRAVRSLAGLPVDFYGTGWRELLGDTPDFRYPGKIHHDDIALLMPHYGAVLNFDPNWQGGVHDRVYTAAAMGVPVLTPPNSALASAGLPPELVITYATQRPALADLLAGSPLLSAQRPPTHLPNLQVLAQHNWSSRMAEWLAGNDATAASVAQASVPSHNTAPTTGHACSTPLAA